MYEQGIFTSAFSKDTHKYARWTKLSYFICIQLYRFFIGILIYSIDNNATV